ncbi:MAG: CIA30 family protein, partial [Planctomycetota bacterium]|nr:CIA30 family protein [Planctomycetota bacterium]
MTLLSIALALVPNTALDAPARMQAAATLQFALDEAEQGPSALDNLEQALELAVRKLGSDSENAARLQSLGKGARFEGFLAGNDGSPWLRKQLESVVSDLRFEPVLEADVPVGFPAWTPVGEIQIQEYPSYRLARTNIQRSGSNGAFWKLFGHIKSQEIAMTAPVETSYSKDENRLAQTSMAFLYGSQDIGQATEEGRVQVVDIPAQVMLSAGMRGFDTRSRVAQTCEQLDAWLQANPDWVATGPPRTMVYNSPMVFGSRRFFEVQYPVKRIKNTLIDFGEASEAERWRPVDDAVMGGRSSSSMERSVHGSCVFEGNLSTENNGGFASIRRAVEAGTLEGARAIRLRVRGDGQTYQLRFRTQGGFNAPSYQAEFVTFAGEWIEVELALETFDLKWRGRPIRDAQPLEPSRILGMGLLIANTQVG